MKKRLFIAIQYLEIGGAERSLIGLLNAIDYSKFDVDLFVYKHTGEFMKLVPPQVRLLPEMKRYAALSQPISQIVRRGYIDLALARLCARIPARRFQHRTGVKESIAIYQYIADYTTPLLPSLHKYGEYDLAISFLIPHNIVRDKVSAKRKWAWIHTDYSFVDVDADDELPVWDAYDKVISISPDVTKGFLGKFPSLAGKIFQIENILSESFVRQQAKEGLEEVEKEISSLCDRAGGEMIRLCSVGRFSYPKAFDRAVHICKVLTDHGSSILWYVVGYGGDEHLIRKAISDTGMQRRFVLVGKKENPYPYINSCDIYVQPSRYEGNAVTVREAQILCKPCVITAYATAHSQIQDGVDGVIVENDVEGAADGIEEFLNNKALQVKIKEYLSCHHYGNEQEARKLEEL